MNDPQESNDKTRRNMELIYHRTSASEMTRNHFKPRVRTEMHTKTMDTA